MNNDFPQADLLRMRDIDLATRAYRFCQKNADTTLSELTPFLDVPAFVPLHLTMMELLINAIKTDSDLPTEPVNEIKDMNTADLMEIMDDSGLMEFLSEHRLFLQPPRFQYFGDDVASHTKNIIAHYVVMGIRAWLSCYANESFCEAARLQEKAETVTIDCPAKHAEAVTNIINILKKEG